MATKARRHKVARRFYCCHKNMQHKGVTPEKSGQAKRDATTYNS